jgi:hypothetical protein
VLSALPKAKYMPSGENATEVIDSSNTFNVAITFYF